MVNNDEALVNKDEAHVSKDVSRSKRSTKRRVNKCAKWARKSQIATSDCDADKFECEGVETG